jgi:hypothetical protein
MPHQIQPVTPSIITITLLDAVTFIGADLGFMPSNVSAQTLHAASAMALLVSNVDIDIIKLLGRSQSDEMFNFLHLITEQIVHDLST